MIQCAVASGEAAVAESVCWKNSAFSRDSVKRAASCAAIAYSRTNFSRSFSGNAGNDSRTRSIQSSEISSGNRSGSGK